MNIETMTTAILRNHSIRRLKRMDEPKGSVIVSLIDSLLISTLLVVVLISLLGLPSSIAGRPGAWGVIRPQAARA